MRRSWLAFSLILLFSVSSTSHAQWIQTHGPETGNVSVLSVDSFSTHLYAVANEGAYRSRDGGLTWRAMVYNGLPGSFFAKGIGASNSVVYASGALGAGGAIFRSTNGGDSWTQASVAGLPVLGIPLTFDINGSTILAGIEGGGVYKSTDDGSTWTSSSTGIPAGTGIGYFARLGPDLYAATSLISPTKGVYRSTNGGSSWSATSLAITGFAGLNGLTATVSGLFASTNTAGVHRTTNMGTTWDKINPDVTTNFATGVAGTNNNLFIGIGSRIFRADANGDNWVAVNTGLPASNPGLSLLSIAATGTTVVAGEGKLGVYRSSDSGANWSRSNTGLIAARINNGMLTTGPYLFAAADGAGFFRTDSNGDIWTGIDNGLDLNVGWYAFAKTGSTLLGGTGAYKLYRSDDNGSNWTLSNAGFTLVGTFAFAVDPATPSTVFAGGYSGLTKSTDSGMTWTNVNSGIGGFQTILALWKDGPYMLYGTNAAFKRSTDNGDTWTAPFTGLPAVAAYGDFAQHDDTIYVASTYGIYRSSDHGASWSSTEAATVGMQTVHAVGGDLFIGGLDGVRHSNDGGRSWTEINEGFPPVTHIMDLVSNDGYLFAGSLRSGVWRRPLSEVTPALASLVSAEAEPGRARIRWFVEAGTHVVIERRTPTETWAELRATEADGLGYVTVEDDGVEPGQRYGYRVGWKDGDRDVRMGEVWIDVPGRTEFALHGARPNPAVREPSVAFTIPRSGRVTIDLMDLSGRRVGERYEADLTAGYHMLPMSSWGTRPAGVYSMRVMFGGVSRTARFVMIR